MNENHQLQEILGHLRALVSFDTQNPPRHIDASSPIFEYLREQLEGFEIEVTDLGEGCVSLLATRGTPKLLMNCHVDTVPANPSWRRDPHDLLVDDGIATGLGACDIKGAAACMLAAAQRTDGDIALLFTSDEEAGSSRCVRAFVEGARTQQLDYDLVLVAEPTECQAILEHRGIMTYSGEFNGVPGHAAQPRALVDSAIHEATRWTARAVDFASEQLENADYKGLEGIAFNIGRIEGGTKPNMIAASTKMRWGIRPLPSQEPRELAEQICQLAERPWRVQWTPGFYGPTLPAPLDGKPGSERVAKLEEMVGELNLSVGDPVNFWTEASIFSEGGFDAFVCGPGNIEQAHAAGEWVSLNDLHQAYEIYCSLMSR